jgi:hypothetical protein
MAIAVTSHSPGNLQTVIVSAGKECEIRRQRESDKAGQLRESGSESDADSRNRSS